MATDEEQMATINTPAWYDSVRAKATEILQMMETNGFAVEGDDAWIVTVIDNIKVRFQERDESVFVQAGARASDGRPVYEGHAPKGWFA